MRTRFLQPFIRMNGWSFGLRVCFVPLSHIVRRWNSHHLAGMLDSAQGSLRLTSPPPELTPSSANPHRRPPPLRPNMHSITRALRTIRISLLAPCASIVFTLGCAGTTKVASSPAAPTSLDSTTHRGAQLGANRDGAAGEAGRDIRCRLDHRARQSLRQVAQWCRLGCCTRRTSSCRDRCWFARRTPGDPARHACAARPKPFHHHSWRGC